MGQMKNEEGRVYGSFVVCKSVIPREPSNGVIKWECKCRSCGKTAVFNGNNLRFRRTGKVCRYCGAEQ